MAKVKQKKAGKAAEAALERAAELRGQAHDLRLQARKVVNEAGLEARAAELLEQAAELAERVRDSEALAKAQAMRGELAAKARERVHDAGLDERAAEMAAKLRDSDRYQHTVETATDTVDRALAKLGHWLTASPAAGKMGVQPAKRTWTKWLLGLIGVAAGFAAGVVVGSRRSQVVEEFGSVASRITQDTPDMAAPAAQKPIEDEVRTRLGSDPRTAGLPKLNINVAEGTVFVRGAVPEGADTEAIREVAANVPGVRDVDLQLGTAGSQS